MESDTGSCQIAPGLQVANDPESPTTTKQLGSDSFITANETTQFQSDWTDISADTKGNQWMRFGVLVKQDSDGAPVQGCLASIKVEVKDS